MIRTTGRDYLLSLSPTRLYHWFATKMKLHLECISVESLEYQQIERVTSRFAIDLPSYQIKGTRLNIDSVVFFVRSLLAAEMIAPSVCLLCSGNHFIASLCTSRLADTIRQFNQRRNRYRGRH